MYFCFPLFLFAFVSLQIFQTSLFFSPEIDCDKIGWLSLLFHAYRITCFVRMHIFQTVVRGIFFVFAVDAIEVCVYATLPDLYERLFELWWPVRKIIWSQISGLSSWVDFQFSLGLSISQVSIVWHHVYCGLRAQGRQRLYYIGLMFTIASGLSQVFMYVGLMFTIASGLSQVFMYVGLMFTIGSGLSQVFMYVGLMFTIGSGLSQVMYVGLMFTIGPSLVLGLLRHDSYPGLDS